MKVELQCGDTIAIPEGCKAVVKDGIVTIEKDVQEFKDGDVLVSVINKHRHNAFIYESTDERGWHSYYVGIDRWGTFQSAHLQITDGVTVNWPTPPKKKSSSCSTR